MSVSYAPTKLSVPPGFEHLLEGLTREVLREQPPNIISFAAQYFRRKLNERPGTHEDVRKSAESVTQSVSQAQKSSSEVSRTELPPVNAGQDASQPVSTNEQQQSVDLNDAEAHRAATLIQTKFREHLTQRQLSSSGQQAAETDTHGSGTATAEPQNSDRQSSDAQMFAGETTQEGDRNESELGRSPNEPDSSHEERVKDGEDSRKSTHEDDSSIHEANTQEGSISEERETSHDEKSVPLHDEEPLSADGREGSIAEDEALDDVEGDNQGEEDTETNQSLTEEEQD
eukprot:Em0006g933a